MSVFAKSLLKFANQFLIHKIGSLIKEIYCNYQRVQNYLLQKGLTEIVMNWNTPSTLRGTLPGKKTPWIYDLFRIAPCTCSGEGPPSKDRRTTILSKSYSLGPTNVQFCYSPYLSLSITIWSKPFFRQSATTHFVLASDIELYPRWMITMIILSSSLFIIIVMVIIISIGLISKFLAMIKRLPHLTSSSPPKVWWWWWSLWWKD